MFFIKLIRYVLGYITFTASGGFSERFINLCAQKKIVLWDVESKGGVIFANTNIIGYKRIKDCAKRSSMKVRIKEKHGIPFLMHKHRVRVGFLVGFIVFILLIVALSTRLWTIEIEGNDEVTNKEILQVFDELGVSTGTRIAKIDVTAVTEQAKDKLEQISWLALNISGSKATIEVRESIKKPKIEQRTPCNIVAAYGGQIIKLEVYEGQTQQVLGAAVAKGDLLISGVVENLDGTAKLKHAKGIIVAKTNRNLAEIQPAKITQEVQVKEKKRYRILFFGLDIP
ncbi:MAG: sporulation protein YqfD, partial [Oscillospiraceae bacterium]